MTDFLDLLKYVIPSLVVFGTAYYFFSAFISNYDKKDRESSQLLLKTTQLLIGQEEKRQKTLLQAEQHKNIIPVRLQAYERLMLLLERISLPNLIMRMNKAGTSAAQMQSTYIKTIREEFDHNLSQQIYISPESWTAIKNAKEECIQNINLAASKLTDTSDGISLSKKILELSGNTERMNIASSMLKNEARSLF